jgi:hypothetical protein
MAARLPLSVSWETRDMADDATVRDLEKIDRRLANVEQILPTLATKEELRAAVALSVRPKGAGS